MRSLVPVHDGFAQAERRCSTGSEVRRPDEAVSVLIRSRTGGVNSSDSGVGGGAGADRRARVRRGLNVGCC